MFDEFQRIARQTLSEDIFPRFVESDGGQTLAKRRADLCAHEDEDEKAVVAPTEKEVHAHRERRRASVAALALPPKI